MEPFLGQISLFSLNFAPSGWLLCDGSTRSISVYQPLYSLIGTKFGGNGSTTFCLPNLNASNLFGMAKYYIAYQGMYPERT
jgi:microcystin-dependent protein